MSYTYLLPFEQCWFWSQRCICSFTKTQTNIDLFPAEKDDVEEAGVEHGHLRNPGLLKGKCPGPHLQEGQYASWLKKKKKKGVWVENSQDVSYSKDHGVILKMVCVWPVPYT